MGSALAGGSLLSGFVDCLCCSCRILYSAKAVGLRDLLGLFLFLLLIQLVVLLPWLMKTFHS